MEVPPAQNPVWRRSHIRQLSGVTWVTGSPDVKARGRLSLNSVGVNQRASNQKGRSESERINSRKFQSSETPRVSTIYPMANAGTEERGRARAGSPGRIEGGNSGESDYESPEGLQSRQEDP